jgi:hypothetical protein
MAASQNNDPEPQDPPEGDPPADDGKAAEEKFWAKIDERLDAAIERGVKKHVPKRAPGTSRAGGRSTFPQIFADLIGGPFESESSRQKKAAGK